MIQNLIFVILFLKILFPQVPMDIINFFIPVFAAENLKANKNQRKRSLILQYSFAQKTSLILRISTLLKLKIICSQNTAKKLSSQFKNFPANMFLLGVRKKHLHCTISWRPRTTFLKHFESKNLSISVYLSKKFLFQRRIKILSGGMGGWGGWIISLRQLAVWVS